MLRLVLAAVLCAPALAIAQNALLNRALNEQVIMIPYGAFGELESTIFRPEGPGPFPLAVINHGLTLGNARFQARYRSIVASRELVRRGYVVALPMRLGFARSSGRYDESGCNVAANGELQADSLRAALKYFVAQPYVDGTRIVLLGQSHGGLTVLALGAQGFPGVRGFVNFAGGLRVSGHSCFNWQDNLVRALAGWGRETKLPSLWFYGENDSYFEPGLVRRMHEAYTAGGGNARLVAYGPFKSDAHGTFGDRDGLAIWWPETERFLESLGMPVALVPRAVPQDSALARLADTSRIPHVRQNCLNLYERFLDADYPRAYAISPEGRCGFSYGGEDPRARALELCRGSTQSQCRLYAIDNEVVWN